MVKRLFVGLFLGAVIGAVAAAVLIQVLNMRTFGPVMAYLAAAATGVVTGLVAGKPIWSNDGKIEAGLKAFFGGLLALGGMFVLRQWVHTTIDLASIKAGAGEVGSLPAVSLPLIAGILASFFELDNTGAPDDEKKDAKSAKPSGKQLRVAPDEETHADDEEEEAAPAKKRR